MRSLWLLLLHASKGTPLQRWVYRRYDRSATWAANPAARAARKRAGGRCESCGRRRRGLQCHHLTYARVGQEIASDFLVVCQPCHRRRHSRSGR